MYVLWRRLASLRVQVSSLTTPLSLVYAYSGLNNPDFSFIFFFLPLFFLIAQWVCVIYFKTRIELGLGYNFCWMIDLQNS